MKYDIHSVLKIYVFVTSHKPIHTWDSYLRNLVFDPDSVRCSLYKESF